MAEAAEMRPAKLQKTRATTLLQVHSMAQSGTVRTGFVPFNGTIGSVESIALLSALTFMTLFSLWYELRCPPKTAGNAGTKKPRIPMWDMMRFFIEWGIIFEHVNLCTTWSGVEFYDQSPLWNRMNDSMTSWRMTGFAFISGIFGSSMAKTSICNMFCYTLGTGALTHLMKLAVPATLTGSLHLPTYLVDSDTWYLFDLFVWKLAITPVFHIMSETLRMPRAFPFLISVVIMYLLRHVTTMSANHESWQLFLQWCPLAYPDGRFGALHFGNYFALGLAVGRERAEQLFLDARTLLLAPLAIFFCNMFFYDILIAAKHTPPEIYGGQITPRSYGSDLRFLSVISINMVAILACIAQFSKLLSNLCPRLSDFVAGCGSRTLYAYVLHLTLAQSISFAPWISTFDPRLHVALFAILSLFLNVVLSSRGAECLFNWWVMPYWIQDLVGWFTANCSHVQKLVDNKLGTAVETKAVPLQ
eukprot:TRINITY_DN8577_c0_g1_i1.p1 TRINITY_DN8577_c0_g1~~TRINITY_DN8577_c0_g1_i1.p1  ORF type:complete len:495 (+),score=36.49 TRINITY_DN8577_c0_g1_i1:67-1485(+)